MRPQRHTHIGGLDPVARNLRPTADGLIDVRAAFRCINAAGIARRHHELGLTLVIRIEIDRQGRRCCNEKTNGEKGGADHLGTYLTSCSELEHKLPTRR